MHFCRCKVHGFYVQADGTTVFKPRFNSIRRLADGGTEMRFSVFAGQTNLFEASTNLVDWTTISAHAATNETLMYHETSQSPARFYRVRTE